IGSAAADLLIWSQLRAAISPDAVHGMVLLTETLYWSALLLCVSLQFDTRIPSTLRGMSAFLSASIGVLCFVLILSHLEIRDIHEQPGDALFIAHLLSAMAFFLAVVATIRLLGTDRLEERYFFFAASAFLWAMTLVQLVRNQFLMSHNLRWLDLLQPIPYLVLIALIAMETPGILHTWNPTVRISSIMRSGGTAFLSFGLLLLGTTVSRYHFWLGASAALLSVICYSVLNLISLSRGIEAEEALMAAKQKLEELAGLDGLTGIPNRRTLDQRLEFEMQAARRSGQPVSLLMIDVDLFKLLNDSRGHLVGDSYLVQVAHALRNSLSRTNDFVARYGGEEFVILLPATSDAGAVRIAGRLHHDIAALRLEHPLSPSAYLTISVGCTTGDSLGHHPGTALIETADRAMYLAKKLGRNRTEFLPFGNRVIDVENAS
ncbi:MAG: diguanylate cyclase, partial [Terracidiphilus sp.]